jgi:hypothetical protein
MKAENKKRKTPEDEMKIVFYRQNRFFFSFFSVKFCQQTQLNEIKLWKNFFLFISSFDSHTNSTKSVKIDFREQSKKKKKSWQSSTQSFGRHEKLFFWTLRKTKLAKVEELRSFYSGFSTWKTLDEKFEIEAAKKEV